MHADEGYVPQELLPISLFDGVVLAARAPTGSIYLVVRDLCATLDLPLYRQLTLMRENTRLQLAVFRIRDGNQIRRLDCLLLDDLPVWISALRIPRKNIVAAERLGYIQRYFDASVRRAFAALTGLTDAPSRTIEDMRDLDKLAAGVAALDALAARQEQIEQSQERARDAWRQLAAQLSDIPPVLTDLQQRLQTVEQQMKLRISAEQRGALYHIVQRWGETVATQRPEPDPGKAIRKCWQQFNARFGIATYTDLPAARYDEALQFVKEQYRTITGRDIDASEQGRLL